MVLSSQHFVKGEAMETVQESGVARASGRGEMNEQEENRGFWGQWNYVVECCDARYMSLSIWHFPGGSVLKNPPANAGDVKMLVWSLGQEDPLEKEMGTHSSTLAWKIPWTEECGRLQPLGSQRVGHNWTTSLCFFSFTPDTSNVHSKLSGNPEVAWLLAGGAQYYFLPAWTLSLGPGQCNRTHDFTSHFVSCLLASSN